MMRHVSLAAVRRTALNAMRIATLSIAGCSTVASRLDKPPIFQASTSKSLSDFQTCFAEKFEKDTFQPSYLPKGSGGTYTHRIGTWQNYVDWVLDVTDDGSVRKVSLHAVVENSGHQKKLLAKVQRCL